MEAAATARARPSPARVAAAPRVPRRPRPHPTPSASSASEQKRPSRKSKGKRKPRLKRPSLSLVLLVKRRPTLRRRARGPSARPPGKMAATGGAAPFPKAPGGPASHGHSRGALHGQPRLDALQVRSSQSGGSTPSGQPLQGRAGLSERPCQTEPGKQPQQRQLSQRLQRAFWGVCGPAAVCSSAGRYSARARAPPARARLKSLGARLAPARPLRGS